MRSKLSDSAISDIFYNYEGRYLLVLYSNSNIDIIDSNDNVHNISSIKETTIVNDKQVNYVAFSGSDAHLATNYGFSVVNGKKYEMKESHIYMDNDNLVPISGVAVMGTQLVLSSGNTLYVSALTASHNKLSDFSAIPVTAYSKINVCAGMSSTDVAVRVPTGSGSTFIVSKVSFDGQYSQVSSTQQLTPSGQTNVDVQSTKYGTLITDAQYITLYDTSAKQISQVKTEIKGYHYGNYSGASTDKFWFVYLGQNERNGMSYGTISEGKTTIEKGPYTLSGCTVPATYGGFFDTISNKLYVYNLKKTGALDGLTNEVLELGYINTYDGSTWADVTPSEVPHGEGLTNLNPLKIFFDVLKDPTDDSSFYIGTFFRGIYHIKDGKCDIHYYTDNSTLKWSINYYCPALQMQFDKSGNLWTIQSNNSSMINILPKSHLNDVNVSKSDWVTSSLKGVGEWGIAAKFLITKNTDVKIFASCDYNETSLIFMQDNGKISDSSSWTVKQYTSFVDQDNKSYEQTRIQCFCEDLNGKVWVGTRTGVFEVDPSNVFKSDFKINHLKVPRKDGTSSADYLLDNITVTCISVDRNNRKWIGTWSDGVYLVSADGSEILKHFNTSNSYLPNNYIGAVVPNPNNNSVYFVTPSGIVEYGSDATEAAEDYSSVSVYPNPVRPEYSGLVTIQGLMDNSLIKITDAMGNAVYTTTSNGGMATWDATNQQGDRVPTGVYYIFASYSDGTTSKGAISKVLVIGD